MKAILQLLVLIPSISFAQLVQDGLIGHWSFNGNGYDSTSYGNDFDIYGASYLKNRNGDLASAISFDGVDDYGIMSHNNQLDMDGLKDNYTIQYWLKSSEPFIEKASPRILEKGNTSGKGYPFSFQVQLTNDSLNLSGIIYSGSDLVLLSYKDGAFDGEWHLISFVVDNSKKYVYGYIDTTLFDSAKIDISGIAANTEELRIGNNYEGTRPYKGLLDDLLIYDRALSLKEVLQNFNDGVATKIGYVEPKTKFRMSGNTIQLDYSGELKIFDVSGKVIYLNSAYNSEPIQLFGLDSGVYFFTLENGEVIKVKK